MDQHDAEAAEVVSSLPEEDIESFNAIGEQPPPAFFSRRKKAIAAVASIVLAGGIAMGVALSLNTNKQQSLDQNGVVQSPPITGDLIDDAAAEESASEQEQLDAESVEYSAVATESLSNNETSHEIPWKGDDPVIVAHDDPTQDIIIDVGHSAEYPDDVIHDAGYEQREPTTVVESVPKVEFNSEDFSLEAAVFGGPISDFIVTPDVSRITVTTASTCPNANDGLWKMTLETDNYPWETSWELLDRENNILASGPPAKRNYARSTRYIGQMCFPAGSYRLKLADRNSDGFCCKYGKGNMAVKVNGNTVAQQAGSESFNEKVFSFQIRPASSNSDDIGKINDSKAPTLRPTERPTRRPTSEPTKPLNNSIKCKNVSVKIVTDRWPEDTSYKLTPVDAPNQILLEKKNDEMKKLTTYKDTKCVQDGQYRLTFYDTFQGIQEGGYYSVEVDGEEVMYGTTFQGGSEIHIIHVGNEPPMTDRERQWLDAHNTRRVKYHEDEGKVPRKLVWSTRLAEEASNWVDEILSNCKISREANLAAGENMSARSSGGERDEGPIPILERWSDNKASKDPSNSSRTQVLWRASRFVGCSEKSLQRQNGTYCYVSICRYLRPGNCAMGDGKAGWKEKTLADRSGCGPVCPGNVCY
mmetsp:Transcript_29630/g.56099  ORF Transcript_29630/g.56099 Transcript_29630/m.56099 type:complete len:642 (-) Transcript_29630:231-2156(-)|eukprot:CAMPEP_0201657004 /NCGR_PEP_ID=MMETSP0494-20130426/382_1 /ASSEMBLY_ACC=CAM_ASM_000839 /TAXON_ID=420259 /ORGANISM="Thalassiosira gravida, Strain GMp14c1" /LENGTH=641 /DNA_ID=CAMNT_0048133745 /DNA_START=136 /DNA_END=2061 /DNA_ORIENTATION=-